MTDKEAVQLLHLLDMYVNLPESEPDATDTLTIRMVAEDLLMSLHASEAPNLSTRLVGD